jgi:hypothetical protein
VYKSIAALKFLAEYVLFPAFLNSNAYSFRVFKLTRMKWKDTSRDNDFTDSSVISGSSGSVSVTGGTSITVNLEIHWTYRQPSPLWMIQVSGFLRLTQVAFAFSFDCSFRVSVSFLFHSSYCSFLGCSTILHLL